MVFDVRKIFVNNIGRKFYKFKQYSIKPCCFVCIERLNDLIVTSFVEAGSKSKLREFGNICYGYNTGMVFVSFNDFFTEALS